MEPTANTSAGKETASQTVARIKAARKAAEANPPKEPGATKANPVLDALAERLTQQGKGISTSSSSNIQRTIEQSIQGVERSGELTAARLQSERGREIGFAQDRASATYTGAFEGRSGYATQTVALRELTETTEKSVRDLDKRYQEAIMANDSATASTVAGLRMEKLKFLQTQEENYFKNMITVAGQMQQQNQFEKEQDRLFQNAQTEAEQFSQKMAQTDAQFTKNLGIQYKNLDLQSQELEIARQRNNISRAEFNLRKSELEKAKGTTALQGMIGQSLVASIKGGVDISSVDPSEDAANYFLRFGGEEELGMNFNEFSSVYMEARVGALETPFIPTPTSDEGFMSGMFGGTSVNRDATAEFLGGRNVGGKLIYGDFDNKSII